MKRAAIALLICLNVVLVAALVWTEGTSKAQAQGGYSANNFVVVTGRVPGTEADTVYVLDLSSAKLLGLHVNSQGMTVEIGRRDLKKDFAVKEGGL